MPEQKDVDVPDCGSVSAFPGPRSFHCEDPINERYGCVDSYGVIRIELGRGRYTLSL